MSAKNIPKTKTRTVKISDGIHHRIRIVSVHRRQPMQELIELLLERGLKRYETPMPAPAETVTA
jgi:hypothetical protein